MIIFLKKAVKEIQLDRIDFYCHKTIMKIILIMGLPGSGKTTLANELAPLLDAKRLNADEVRKENDWDFSKRQSKEWLILL